MSGALARPMLAGIFIVGGLDALRDPESKVKAADDVAPMIAGALHLPTTDTVTLVRINGGIQVVAATLLALGKRRRVSALVLAASLVPTTYAGHRFWQETDAERRAQQRIQFLKNAAMLGGLLLAAGDTGGRPSVPWQARRATTHAIEAAAAAGAVTEDAAKHVLASARSTKKSATKAAATRAAITKAAVTKATAGELADHAHQLAQLAKESEIKKGAVKAAKKAAKKATKAEFTRRALKAARKAQTKARKAEGSAIAAATAAADAIGQAAVAAGAAVNDGIRSGMTAVAG